MEIIDAHHHLWDTNHLRYPLFDNIPSLNRPFTVSDFQAVAQCSGISRSVCIEAASAGADGLEETTWLLAQANSSTIVTRLVVWAPVEQPAITSYLDQIAELNDGSIVGIRRSFEFEPEDFPARDETIAGIKAAASHGYSCDLVLFSPSLPAVLELVRACPEVSFILDHLGKPLVRAGVLHPWQEQIVELAKFPNIVCKISGLTTEADHQTWAQEDLKRYIDHALSCFGWDRVMFGSDWPVCELAGSYRRWLTAVQWAVADATEEDRCKLFSGNARRVYHFDQR
jgi:L-fuconolactonase